MIDRNGFHRLVNQARRRLDEMDTLDGELGFDPMESRADEQQLGVILVAIQTGICTGNLSSVADAYVMVERMKSKLTAD